MRWAYRRGYDDLFILRGAQLRDARLDLLFTQIKSAIETYIDNGSPPPSCFAV